MTREEARKAAEVMMAYADGKDIEYTEGYGVYWQTTPHPVFDWVHFDYRIKQEPTYRPFKNQEECWNEMLNHQPFGWLKAIESGDYYEISGVHEDTDFEHYARRHTFADGTPFGIKEE